jgi:dTDP-4-amino-4,6-dideoxygalactose transaminase
MAAIQARLAARRLASLPAKVDRRRAVARRYSAWAVAHGRTPAHEPDDAGHAFLRYPLRVREPAAFLAEADRRGVLLGDWFHSPLYPIEGDLTPWGYRRGEHPVAERAVSEIVNLPTDVTPDGREARAVDALLEACVDRIL